jgi:hypothetical protein
MLGPRAPAEGTAVKLIVLVFGLLVAGCSGAAPSASSEEAAGGADLSVLEPEAVYSGAAGTGRRGGVALAVGDEARVLDLGRSCVRDREAAGPLCSRVDEPSAAAVSVQVDVANGADVEVRVDPRDAIMYAGSLRAEPADQYAGSLRPVAVAAGGDASGSMVWVLSGSVADVQAAMAAGDYGFEVVVRGPDDEPIVTRTTVGVLTSEAPSAGEAPTDG